MNCNNKQIHDIFWINHYVWVGKVWLLAILIKYLYFQPHLPGHNQLTHWVQVTHICVSELTIIDSDNGFLAGRRQAIIWNNAGLLLIEPLGTNFSEISIRIQTFSFKKMHLNHVFWEMVSILSQPQCVKWYE